MAKIIKPGKIPPKFTRFYVHTCDKCGCIAEYEEVEVRMFPSPPFPIFPGDDSILKRNYVKCAFCKEVMTFDRSESEVIERERKSLLSTLKSLFK